MENRTHVDTVVAYRQRYLSQQSLQETDEKFLQYSRDLEIDWTAIKEKIRADKDREEEANK